MKPSQRDTLLHSSAVRLFLAPSTNAKLKRVILCRDIAKTLYVANTVIPLPSK
jgi:hypothetical protein